MTVGVMYCPVASCVPDVAGTPFVKRWGRRDVLLRLGSCLHRKQHRRRNHAELKRLLDRMGVHSDFFLAGRSNSF
jgi:hypothetical protein